jgi:hypothetical protein
METYRDINDAIEQTLDAHIFFIVGFDKWGASAVRKTATPSFAKASSVNGGTP